MTGGANRLGISYFNNARTLRYMGVPTRCSTVPAGTKAASQGSRLKPTVVRRIGAGQRCVVRACRDRAGKGDERIRFTSAILPPYARRSKSLEVQIRALGFRKAVEEVWPN